MSAEDNNNAQKKGSSIRAMLDFVMGALYIGIAIYIMFNRHFGTKELTTGVVIGMSALLTVYGLFRIYLGVGRYRNR